MKPEKNTAGLKSTISELLKLFQEDQFASTLAILKSKLDIYNRTSVLDDSLRTLRDKHGIKVLKFESDFAPMHPDADVISVYSASQWYCALSKEKDLELTRDILGELRRLELPIFLMEKYLETLLYNWELKTPMISLHLLPNLMYCSDTLKDVALSTEEKKYLNQEFRQLLGIKQKGRIPKKIAPLWDKFKKEVIDSKPSKYRRFREVELKQKALEEKGTIEVLESVSEGVKLGKETDKDKFAEAEDELDFITTDIEDNLRRERQGVNRLRKHRELLKKEIKKKSKK